MFMSLFLAKALGLYFLIVGFALVFKAEQMKRLIGEIVEDKALLFVSGFLSLIIGILMIISHNVWVMGWPVVITVTAWISLIKGVVRIVYPEQGIELIRKCIQSDSSYYLMSVITLLLGLFLTYHGFF